mgnify:CR=1 FL=1
MSRKFELPERDGLSTDRAPRHHVGIEAVGPAVHLHGENGREVGPERDKAVGHCHAGGDAGKPRKASHNLVPKARQGCTHGHRHADGGPERGRRQKMFEPGHTCTSSLDKEMLA